jgi:spermidine synthase
MVRMFKGSVLIHGLGLGCAVRMALQAGAERVTVIELDQDVIDHVAPHLNDERVTIYQGDALTRRWPVGSTWTVVWHDIWDTICGENLPEMHRLHRSFGGRSLWQGSWARSTVERLR